jgi:hypothetical protein
VTEKVDFRVVGTVDDVELRRYPTIILATVPGMSDDSAFEILFDYITGTNRSRQRIPMTAPVISSNRSSERIPMTVPVVSDDTKFSFVLPMVFTMSTVPEPLDDRILLEEVSERQVAVLRFRGGAGKRDIARKTEHLLDVLAKHSIKPKEKPFLMRYNPPFVPGFLRRNEVAIQVQG